MGIGRGGGEAGGCGEIGGGGVGGGALAGGFGAVGGSDSVCERSVGGEAIFCEGGAAGIRSADLSKIGADVFEHVIAGCAGYSVPVGVDFVGVDS